MALGLSRTSITNIERGRQPIQLHTLYKIAEVLGVEPTALLPGVSDSWVPERSETTLKQNEWLQKITPHGDETNATISANNPRARK
jgi:transcriptional regulator with XRE-family HTH domain